MSVLQTLKWERTRLKLGVAGMLVVASLAICAVARAESQPATSGGPATFRRLSAAQYTRSIGDIFGADIKVPGRFEPPLRDEGLMAIGDSKVDVTSSGFEQYELRAREISAQVLADDRRKNFLSCAPRSLEVFDKFCASQFLGKYGRLLFRRPLTEAEMTSALTVTNATTKTSGNFYKGLESGLARLLASPNFIFRVEQTEGPPRNGTLRLDDYSLASRISFLLWDAAPDAELMDAAASGALHSEDGLEKQVDRLINSPRFAEGVRAFFSDMFAYEQFDGLTKDQSIYPKYTSQLSKDAAEQTMRTVVDLLVTNKGDYRDLFTTKKTFLSRRLASLYRVPVDGAAVDGWIPYTFGPDDPRAGILTFAAFLVLDPTHEGKTSPTIRGKSVRELLLCQKIPAPPGNVDFSKFQDPKNPNATVRERLTAHRESPTCAGCHSIMDPIGLGMENYDGVGDYRTTEHGAVIDASGSFEGKPYNDLIGLEKLLYESPTVSNCVVERAYEYGVGRPVAGGEREWLKYTSQRFADEHYVFPALMQRIATSKAFQTISADSVAPGAKVASSN